MVKTYYTAYLTFAVDHGHGPVEKQISEDVTDEVNAGTNHEELVDRLYWKHCHDNPAFRWIVAGGVTDVI